MIINCFLLMMTFSLTAGEQSIEEAFTNIYQHRIWGTNSEGEGTSGWGSALQATETYREFLQDFFIDFDIHTVVDVGCGDWEFSRVMNWEGIHYIGYDVVPFLIEKNQAKYATETIQFIYADATQIDLPHADLLIFKDVLQHLSNQDILKFIQQLGKFKYCLITNDVNPTTLTSDNPDIVSGWHRHLDLTQPPFSLKGTKILTFRTYTDLKQVLLIH